MPYMQYILAIALMGAIIGRVTTDPTLYCTSGFQQPPPKLQSVCQLVGHGFPTPYIRICACMYMYVCVGGYDYPNVWVRQLTARLS